MVNQERRAKKMAYIDKLIDLCMNSSKALMVSIDNVTSRQIQVVRRTLRGRAVVLMGKNSLIKRGLLFGEERHPGCGFEEIRDNVSGNMGFIFLQGCEMDEVKKILGETRTVAAAKPGQESMCNMEIPAGPTGMDPSQTNFFQALNIATKIVKGQIELVSEFPILKAGEKVSPSVAVLLSKLGIKPFEYGMEIVKVFQDGTVFDAKVLELSDAELMQKFIAGIANMAAFSREIGIPTEAGLPHAFGNAFKNVAALIADVDFEFEEVAEVKKFLADPDAYAAANPAAAAPAAGGGGGGAAPAAAAAAVVEEEEEEDMDFDLFG